MHNFNYAQFNFTEKCSLYNELINVFNFAHNNLYRYTEPNELMTEIHDRMPVILRVEDEKNWLDKEQKIADLQALLRPFPAEGMFAYPVSKLVGNVKNDSSACIEALQV
ncbi:MAG: SOS response-associated peptidase family protein [Paenibacillaceae bacterium]